MGPDCPAGGLPGQPGVTQLAPPGSIDSLSGSAASITLPQPVREQEAVEIVASGPSGSPLWLIYSSTPGIEVFPPHGVLHVAADFRMLFLGTLPVTGGPLIVPITVGDLAPGVDHARLFVQPLVLNSSAAVTLGTPLTLVLVDEAF